MMEPETNTIPFNSQQETPEFVSFVIAVSDNAPDVM